MQWQNFQSLWKNSFILQVTLAGFPIQRIVISRLLSDLRLEEIPGTIIAAFPIEDGPLIHNGGGKWQQTRSSELEPLESSWKVTSTVSGTRAAIPVRAEVQQGSQRRAHVGEQSTGSSFLNSCTRKMLSGYGISATSVGH